MKTTVLIVAAFLLTVTLFAGTGGLLAEIDEHTNQNRHALAVIHEKLIALAEAGFLDRAFPDSFAAAADIGTGCSDRAKDLCGQDDNGINRICCFCMCVDNGVEVCQFSCWDQHGNCQPCPACPCDGTSSLAVL